MLPLAEISIFCASLFIITTFKLVNRNPPAILNVYQRPNGFFWFKFIFIYLHLSFRKLVNKLKYKFRQQNIIESLIEADKPQKLSVHEKAIDAVYVNGASKNGDYLVSGIARRKNKLVDGFLYILIEDSKLGLLETPKLPSTSLYQTEDVQEYTAEGITISSVIPTKKWKISYEGKMKRYENRKELVDVKLEAEWSFISPLFNFDTDMDVPLMAKSMAFEKFSGAYFENLKEKHQTHFEQFGDLKGVVTINGQNYNINMNAVRDHTFGFHREWRNFHRYALHYASTENGDRFNIGMLCLPITFSRLIIGYVYSAEDKKMYPIKYCDFQLHQHGEDGNPPLDYAFRILAGNKWYTVQVNVLHSPHFYLSKDWECKVIERLCTFEINNIKGWGAAEWQYRNIDEKNVPDYNG